MAPPATHTDVSSWSFQCLAGDCHRCTDPTCGHHCHREE